MNPGRQHRNESESEGEPVQPGPEDDGSFSFTASEADEGRRLDRILADLFPDFPRARFHDWIDAGQVTVSGERKKQSYRLRPGDQVRLSLPPEDEIDIKAEDIPLELLYDDEDIVVVNKPAGLTVHPAPHMPHGTLVNALMGLGLSLSDYHEDRFRPGIVHRLDRGTSGVIVVAKNRPAHHALSKQFERRTVDKEYRAVVNGCPDHEEGFVELPLGRSRANPLKMAVREDLGRPASTRFRVLERYPGFSYLSVEIFTGRTHQIRVHLAHERHPLVGDPLYGGGPGSVTRSFLAREEPREGEQPLVARPALHSFRLTIDHPVLHERMCFSAPIPQDMARLLEALSEIRQERSRR